jgi:hypothetical protein
VPSLDDVVRSQTSLSGDDLRWLRLLVADWQIIADLSFADLVLWLPDADGNGFWAGAQMRPTTGPTALLDDVVGAFVPAAAARCSTRRGTRAGSCARATPSGATRFPYAWRPSPCGAPGASSA